MKWKVLDIETGPLGVDRLRDIMPEFEPSKVLKDPEKIAADLNKKRNTWLANAALDASTGRLLAIGLLDETDKVTIYEGAAPEEDEDVKDALEKTMLNALWELWGERKHRWITHNGRNFDFPFLMRRSWILGVHVPGDVMQGRFMDDQVKDTLLTWACGTRDMIGLDALGKALGVGSKLEGGGANFAFLYATDREAALEYLRQDLRLTRDCARKMGMLA